jgi:hypothetical protein
MAKTITLRISDDHYRDFRNYAQKENRRVSNAIETLALKQLEKVRLTEDLEAESILSDENLVGRIRAGVKQAKERKGRFELIVLRPTRR